MQRTLVHLAFSCTLALALGACNGDDGSSGGGSDTETSGGSGGSGSTGASTGNASTSGTSQGSASATGTTSAGSSTSGGGSSTSGGGSSTSGGGSSTSGGGSSTSGGGSSTSGGGSTTGGGMCDPGPNPDICTQCVAMHCCQEATACEADVNCTCWVDCINNGGGQTECGMMCGAPGQVFFDIVSCVQQNCGQQC